MTAFYVDVSHHDRARRGRALDWVAIRQHTSQVMVARATYGDPSGWNRDSRYHAEFHTGAKAAGFDVRGSYHNLVKGDQSSINRQVDWLRREMDAVGAVWAMLDVERYPELVTSDMWPRWDDVQQFCDRWHAVDKRVLTAYIPGWLYGSYYAGRDVRALRTPLVESDYGSNPGGLPTSAYAARGGDGGRGWLPTGNTTPSVWQFSSECDMPGASGQTDINAFRGTAAQLRAFLVPATAPAPTPLTEEAMSYGQVTGNPTVWRSDGRTRVAMKNATAWAALVKAGAKLALFANEADLTDALGPVDTGREQVDVNALAAAMLPALQPIVQTAVQKALDGATIQVP